MHVASIANSPRWHGVMRPIRKIAFVSPHCAVDFTNGAATATLDALVFLQSLGFQCEVFCNSRLDSPDEVVVEKMLAERGLPCMARNAKIGAYRGRMIFTVYTSVNKDSPASGLASVQNRLKPELQQDGPIFANHSQMRPTLAPGPSPGGRGENGAVPVTIFNSVSTRGAWKDREEVAAFLTGCEIFLRKNRPDVVWTYGGDPVSLAVQQLAKRLGMGVLFFLHNFSYRGLESFRAVDWIAVPSQFSRHYYRRSLGLECEVLPYVIDSGRVLAATRATSPLPDPLPEGEGDIWPHPSPLPTGKRPHPSPLPEGEGTFVTFVNPLPAKGLYAFARIAEVLSRRRPDIRLLVIEGRSGPDWRQATGIDLARLPNVTARPAMPDPRAFYAVTKVLLMPSLWNESFGLAAAEAMMNGIPVLASNRGALPETIGVALPTIERPGALHARQPRPADGRRDRILGGNDHASLGRSNRIRPLEPRRARACPVMAYRPPCADLLRFLQPHRLPGRWRQRIGDPQRASALALHGRPLNAQACARALECPEMPTPLPPIPDLPAVLCDLIRQVPRGRVTTPGTLAAAMGNPVAARWIGHFLLHHGHDSACTCHRVVRAGGVLGPYPDGSEEKTRRLEVEGVAVFEGQIQGTDCSFADFACDRPLEKLARFQNRLAKKVELLSRRGVPRLVGGVDVSYCRKGDSPIFADPLAGARRKLGQSPARKVWPPTRSLRWPAASSSGGRRFAARCAFLILRRT